MSHGHPSMFQSNHLGAVMVFLRIPSNINLFEITESGTPGFQNDCMGLAAESKHPMCVVPQTVRGGRKMLGIFYLLDLKSMHLCLHMEYCSPTQSLETTC